MASVGASVSATETLPNGITLSDTFPPNYARVKYEGFFNRPSLTWNAPMPVPYLENPPAVIPIDLGRQLFVDDFLIENTQLRRTWHKPEYHPASPVLGPDQPWEMREGENVQWGMPYSHGAWWDPKDKLFKLWYLGGIKANYATSRDGIKWDKPNLDVVPGTNIVVNEHVPGSESHTVWLDHNERDPAKRFKMWTGVLRNFRGVPGNNAVSQLRFSPDGIHWTKPVWESGLIRDRTTVFYNPFRKVWVHSIKLRPTELRAGERPLAYARSRAYYEAPDVLTPWDSSRVVPWIGADKLDLNRNSTIGRQVLEGQHLYNLDAVAYESLMLGAITIYHDDGDGPYGKWHHNDVVMAFSRDGFHWDRRNREPFMGAGDDRNGWNWTNIQSTGGICLVVADQLYFYCSGRNNRIGTTGLAILRRDGFASMDAGDEPGELITRPVKFSGRHLFVNAKVGGELRVEVLQEDLSDFHNRAPKTIGAFTNANCQPVRGDSTLQRVTWKGAKDLSELAGRTVRFKFTLMRGSLYSFWVSPDESGASNGYVAAGGPGYSADRDTVGKVAYEAAKRITN